MVRLTAEFDLPAEDVVVFGLTMKLLSEKCPTWELVGVDRAQQEPPCPACGRPMRWDAQFAGYLCHHPE